MGATNKTNFYHLLFSLVAIFYLFLVIQNFFSLNSLCKLTLKWFLLNVLDIVVLVLLAVVPWKIQRVAHLSLLIVEMIPHQLLKLVHLLLALQIPLDLVHDLEETNVLLVEPWVGNFELIVPDVWL